MSFADAHGEGAAQCSKFPRDGQIKSMVESRREINPISGRDDFFPALAGRNGHSNYCANAATEKSANAGDRAGAHDLTTSATVGQGAASSRDTGAQKTPDRRIDASGARTFAHVESRYFLAQYRYRLVATGYLKGHGVIAHPLNGADDFVRRDLRRENAHAHSGSERLQLRRVSIRGRRGRGGDAQQCQCTPQADV
jgi:hypothetical protein